MLDFDDPADLFDDCDGYSHVGHEADSGLAAPCTKALAFRHMTLLDGFDGTDYNAPMAHAESTAPTAQGWGSLMAHMQLQQHNTVDTQVDDPATLQSKLADEAIEEGVSKDKDVIAAQQKLADDAQDLQQAMDQLEDAQDHHTAAEERVNDQKEAAKIRQGVSIALGFLAALTALIPGAGSALAAALGAGGAVVGFGDMMDDTLDEAEDQQQEAAEAVTDAKSQVAAAETRVTDAADDLTQAMEQAVFERKVVLALSIALPLLAIVSGVGVAAAATCTGKKQKQ